MDAGTFDGVLRRAAKTIDRRGSLKILGSGVAGAATALGWRAGAADAGNNGKGRCRRQRGQCLDFVQRRCEREIQQRAEAGPVEADPQCVADFNPCCESFAKCQAGAGLRCLTARRAAEAT